MNNSPKNFLTLSTYSHYHIIIRNSTLNLVLQINSTLMYQITAPFFLQCSFWKPTTTNSYRKPLLTREYVALYPIPNNPASFKNCWPKEIFLLLQSSSSNSGVMHRATHALYTKVKEQGRNTLSFISLVCFFTSFRKFSKVP